MVRHIENRRRDGRRVLRRGDGRVVDRGPRRSHRSGRRLPGGMLEVRDTTFHMGQDLRLEGVVVHGGHAVDPQPLFGGLGIAQRSFELEPQAAELFLMTPHDGLDRLDR